MGKYCETDYSSLCQNKNNNENASVIISGVCNCTISLLRAGLDGDTDICWTFLLLQTA